jgi:hypothetical protein
LWVDDEEELVRLLAITEDADISSAGDEVVFQERGGVEVFRCPQSRRYGRERSDHDRRVFGVYLTRGFGAGVKT